MNHLVFSIAWTIFCAVLSAAFFRHEGFDSHPTWFNTLAILMPFVGLLFVWDSLRKLRRYRSVREEGGTYVWTELDGSEVRSKIDPRIKWREDDRNFAD